MYMFSIVIYISYIYYFVQILCAPYSLDTDPRVIICSGIFETVPTKKPDKLQEITHNIGIM